MNKRYNEKELKEQQTKRGIRPPVSGCQCPSCGLTIENTEGYSCQQLLCPTCHVPMEGISFRRRI